MHVSAPAIAESEITKETSPQDWELLITPGHVLRERIVSKIAPLFPLALACGVAAVAMAIVGPRFIEAAVPNAVYDALLTNPNTYTDLGDGVRTSYRLAWLAELPRANGLTGAGWTSLVEAVKADLSAHGLDAASWATVADLETAPRITRPERVFSENVDRLATGVVAVPEATGYSQNLDVVGWVDGRLSWVAVDRYGCTSLLGPSIEGCLRTAAEGPNAVERMASFQPVTVQEGE